MKKITIVLFMVLALAVPAAQAYETVPSDASADVYQQQLDQINVQLKAERAALREAKTRSVKMYANTTSLLNAHFADQQVRNDEANNDTRQIIVGAVGNAKNETLARIDRMGEKEKERDEELAWGLSFLFAFMLLGGCLIVGLMFFTTRPAKVARTLRHPEVMNAAEELLLPIREQLRRIAEHLNIPPESDGGS